VPLLTDLPLPDGVLEDRQRRAEEARSLSAAIKDAIAFKGTLATMHRPASAGPRPTSPKAQSAEAAQEAWARPGPRGPEPHFNKPIRPKFTVRGA